MSYSQPRAFTLVELLVVITIIVVLLAMLVPALDRAFLDANVLFSAAYREDTGLATLWRLRQTERVTSAYAAAEAQANLQTDEQRKRLGRLLADVETIAETAHPPSLPAGVKLPEKDRPILQAAIDAGAAYLFTGDFRHFGPWFGKAIAGVTILPPAEYLAKRTRRGQ